MRPQHTGNIAFYLGQSVCQTLCNLGIIRKIAVIQLCPRRVEAETYSVYAGFGRRGAAESMHIKKGVAHA